jgi:hypothetical protein
MVGGHPPLTTLMGARRRGLFIGKSHTDYMEHRQQKLHSAYSGQGMYESFPMRNTYDGSRYGPLIEQWWDCATNPKMMPPWA